MAMRCDHQPGQPGEEAVILHTQINAVIKLHDYRIVQVSSGTVTPLVQLNLRTPDPALDGLKGGQVWCTGRLECHGKRFSRPRVKKRLEKAAAGVTGDLVGGEKSKVPMLSCNVRRTALASHYDDGLQTEKTLRFYAQFEESFRGPGEEEEEEEKVEEEEEKVEVEEV
ncbi:hypothetical protein Pmani_022975 [Petrolisthes manimaculis]|uniref:Uncharacterized protein n=1 Tax=Petrolisthes manimaculis TaxID=1843537 RepID=A0AAE1U3X2_9EUCA|nr:hypothetical protein Pmani_022975 [Petrolisthes manimaculis]